MLLPKRITQLIEKNQIHFSNSRDFKGMKRNLLALFYLVKYFLISLILVVSYDSKNSQKK